MLVTYKLEVHLEDALKLRWDTLNLYDYRVLSLDMELSKCTKGLLMSKYE